MIFSVNYAVVLNSTHEVFKLAKMVSYGEFNALAAFFCALGPPQCNGELITDVHCVTKQCTTFIERSKN